MVTSKKTIGLGVALALVAGSAGAQLRPQYRFPDLARDTGGPAAVRLGTSPVYMTPTVSAAIGHDSNVTNLDQNERDSLYRVFGADVVFDARSVNSVLVADLYATVGRYNDSPQDNYIDSGARASYDVAFSPRNFLRLDWAYLRSHEGRGTTDRAFVDPLLTEPDKYRLHAQGFTYAFGAPGAKGRVELYGRNADRRYLNNRESTVASDRNTKEYGAVFYWRAMPKTYVLAEARQTELNYLLVGSPLSGEETKYFVGATWEATAATSGTVKVGQFEKKFDLSGATFRDPAYEVSIDWSPRTYSNFNFFGLRTPTESTGLGRFIVTDLVGASWNHEWNSYVATTASVRFQKDNYEGIDRKDDTTTMGLKANYKFRRWLTFGAEYLYSTRDSTVNRFGYDRNIWLLSANLSM